jgi:hypothetical protein
LEEGEELCNCEFSLAYGAKILLNNATMRLLRGNRCAGLACTMGWGGQCVGRRLSSGSFLPEVQHLQLAAVEPAAGSFVPV